MMKYSSSRILQETRILNVEELTEMANIGRLEFKPIGSQLPILPFQKKSQIIESLILGLPVIDQVWADQDALGKFQLLSGFDIISTIIEFISNKFSLVGLNFLQHLNKSDYFSLSYAEKKHLLQMEISFNFISYESNPLLKCFFIKNINQDKYLTSASQLARNITFEHASQHINELSEMILNKIIDNNYNKIRYLDLRIQRDISYCLLMVYLKNNIINFGKNIALESYSYSRSHTYYYNQNDIKINNTDTLDNAINKIMLMLENNTIMNDLFYLKKCIYLILQKKIIDIDTIGKNFKKSSYENKFGLVDYVFSYLTHHEKKLNLSSTKLVSYLIEEMLLD